MLAAARNKKLIKVKTMMLDFSAHIENAQRSISESKLKYLLLCFQ